MERNVIWEFRLTSVQRLKSPFTLIGRERSEQLNRGLIRKARRLEKNIQRAKRATLELLDPDPLKSFVCNKIVSIWVTEREDFIQAQIKMRRANLDMRD